MLISPYEYTQQAQRQHIDIVSMLQAHMACQSYRHRQDTSYTMTLTRSMSSSTPGAGWQDLITNGKASTSVISM